MQVELGELQRVSTLCVQSHVLLFSSLLIPIVYIKGILWGGVTWA